MSNIQDEKVGCDNIIATANAFFKSINQKKKRCIADKFGCVKRGTVTVLVARLTLHLMANQRNGPERDIAKLMESLNVISSFADFKPGKGKNAKVEELVFSTLISELPETEQRKTRAAINAEKQTSEGEKNGTPTQNSTKKVPPFSLSELARLLVLVRDDPEAGEAAECAVNRSFDKKDLQNHTQRADFWVVIATKFNSPEVKCRLSLAGLLDDIDASQPPTVLRPPTFLSDQFGKARNAFSAPWGRYSRSGFNDTNDIDDCMKEAEKNEDGSLNVKGQKAMLIFSVARVGTPYVDEGFLNKILRTIGGGHDPKIGREEGVTPKEAGDTGKVMKDYRRTRMAEEDMAIAKASKAVVESANVLRDLQKRKADSVTPDQEKKKRRSEIMGDILKAQKDLNVAEENGDEEVIEFGKERLQFLKEEMRSLRKDAD